MQINLIKGIGRFKPAQHIVELALLAPFIIIFIGFAAEIAMVINANYKFNSSVYESISLMALTNKINVEKEDTVSNIKEYTRMLLKQKHAPYAGSLEIDLVQTDDIDFLIGTYKYKSTFTIFNAVKDFTLSTYNFLTVIPLNSAILRKNSFDIDDDFFKNGFRVVNPKEEISPTEPDEEISPDENNEGETRETDENISAGTLEVSPSEITVE